MSLGVVDRVFAGFDIPYSPRSDYLYIRSERLYRELEANLIVALAGRAVTDGYRALFLSYLDQSLRDYRTRVRGAEQIFALVYRSRLESREYIILHILVAKVFYIQL